MLSFFSIRLNLTAGKMNIDKSYSQTLFQGEINLSKKLFAKICAISSTMLFSEFISNLFID